MIQPFANYFSLLLNPNLVGKNIYLHYQENYNENKRSGFAKNFLLLIKTAMKKIMKIYNQEPCLKIAKRKIRFSRNFQKWR